MLEEEMFELNLLEYPKIREKIIQYSVLNSTKEEIGKLSPSTDFQEVKKNLEETEEAKESILRLGKLEIEFFDAEETIKRLKISATINAQEFLEIVKLIDNGSQIAVYSKKAKALEIKNERLDVYTSSISDLKDVKKDIQNIIDFDGSILDTASIELSKIRKSIRVLEARAEEKFNQILKSESSKLSESIITIRGGHRVIPVKTEFKNQIKGIVMDESSSGSTVFIEPYSCLEIENEIELKHQEEAREIDKILWELSMRTALKSSDIESNYSIIENIDFIFAKAMYAIEENSIMPLIEDEIDLIDARHPLLDKDCVVPNTITLKDKKMMIITGPNTGGKTVVLKTVGLLSLMAQSGILIPVKEGSKITVFSGIYADIGDEQSIEQSLSTFSSHMKRIVEILKNAQEHSLVLLDELGSGTDPKEGASLAISIIDTLKERNLYAIATTHYPELKAYAYNNQGVMNASVEFDSNTLRPTFRLLIGIPGRSNAFLISKRLGLDKEVIKKAEEVNLEFKDDVSSFIKKLEDEAESLNRMKEEYSSLNKTLLDKIEENKKETAELKAKLNKEIENINTKKNSILEKTQKEASELIEEISELKKDLEDKKPVKDHLIAEVKGLVSNLYQDKYIKEPTNNKDITVGDFVNVLKYDKTGIVTSIKKNRYEVSLGALSSTFDRSEIEYAGKNKKEERNTQKSEKVLRTDIGNSLDLRGKRYEEALELLDKFVDDCLFSNLEYSYVVHGYGTLALRNMVIDYAKTHDVVKKYRFGDENEGGNGVTVLYFK